MESAARTTTVVAILPTHTIVRRMRPSQSYAGRTGDMAEARMQAGDLSRESPRVFRQTTRLANGTIRLAFVAVATAALALAGGFGSWREPLVERLAFWTIGPAVGTALS